MSDTNGDFYESTIKKNSVIVPLLLFLSTCITTVFAGLGWVRGFGTMVEIEELTAGIPYAASLIAIIGFHEFGHYFASVRHKVKATYPHFIPFPPIPGMLTFGTFGAVIRTKTPILNKKALFDIGVAGPIAGFVITCIVLIYGFSHLPGKEFILSIHPDYDLPSYGKDSLGLIFGDTLLFSFLRSVLTSPGDFIPPMSEIYHYPYLCAGWFGLLITSMNLLPVGQLDGGHIIYALFGKKVQSNVAHVFWILLVVFGLVGLLNDIFELRLGFGFSGWLVWALLLFLVVKIKHPPVYDEAEISPLRKVLGYFAIVIFIVSFSPVPLEMLQ